MSLQIRYEFVEISFYIFKYTVVIILQFIFELGAFFRHFMSAFFVLGVIIEFSNVVSFGRCQSWLGCSRNLIA